MASGDASLVFHDAGHALDAVAVSIPPEVAGRRVSTVCLGRDDGQDVGHEEF